MYILATEVLAEVVWGHHAVVNRWYEITPKNEMYISVISVGMLQHAIEGIPGESRQTWRDNLCRYNREFDKRGKVLGVDIKTANQWARLRLWKSALPGLHGNGEVGTEDRLLIATALRYDYALVDRERPIYTELAARFGVRREDPYGLTP